MQLKERCERFLASTISIKPAFFYFIIVIVSVFSDTKNVASLCMIADTYYASTILKKVGYFYILTFLAKKLTFFNFRLVPNSSPPITRRCCAVRNGRSWRSNGDRWPMNCLNRCWTRPERRGTVCWRSGAAAHLTAGTPTQWEAQTRSGPAAILVSPSWIFLKILVFFGMNGVSLIPSYPS